MSTLLSACCVDYCAEISLYGCVDIPVNGLEIETLYFWTLTDQDENSYTGSGTTDTNGQLLILVDGLPPGLLTYGAGQFNVSVSLTDGGQEEVFTIGETDYSCLQVTIVAPAEVDPCADVIGNYAIEIDTDDATEMQTAFSGNSVDIYFKGRASNRVYRDMMTEPYFSKMDDLGVTNMMYPVGGRVQNLTNPPIVGNNPDGYGFEEGDFEGAEEDIHDYGDHVGDPDYPLWGASFAEDFIELKDAIGVQGDLAFNVRFGTEEEMDWWIANLNPQFIGLGIELQNFITGAEYKAKAVAMRDYLNANHPGKEIIYDCPLVYKTNQVSLDFAAQVQTIGGPGHGKYYLQVRDRVPGISSNMESNVALLQNYFDVLLPSDLATFKVKYPTWKMAIEEINLEDQRAEQLPNYIENTVVGNWGVGKAYEFILQHTSDISYAAWMDLKDLINNHDVTSNNYATLKQLSPIFTTDFVGTVTFEGLDGVSGVIAWTGTQYYLLVNSMSAIEYNVPVSALTIDGIAFAGTVNRSTRFGTNWDSGVQAETATGETVLKIMPYSSTVFGFNVV